MYAVIKTGGKQYRVKNGDIIEVEKLTADAGSTISLSPVLMFNDDKSSKVGTPILEGAVVSAEVLEQTRGDKIIVFKKKRRKGYRRTIGHRQDFTLLKITDVAGKSKAKPERVSKEASDAEQDKKGAAKPKASKRKTATARTAKPEDVKSAEKKPAAKKAAAKKPAAKKAATKKPAAKKAATKKPAAKKAATKKPAAKSTDKE
jgi:large subunit ribosomal protein L21